MGHRPRIRRVPLRKTQERHGPNWNVPCPDVNRQHNREVQEVQNREEKLGRKNLAASRCDAKCGENVQEASRIHEGTRVTLDLQVIPLSSQEQRDLNKENRETGDIHEEAASKIGDVVELANVALTCCM